MVFWGLVFYFVSGKILLFFILLRPYNLYGVLRHIMCGAVRPCDIYILYWDLIVSMVSWGLVVWCLETLYPLWCLRTLYCEWCLGNCCLFKKAVSTNRPSAWRQTINWKRCRRKPSWPNCTFYLGILWRLWSTTK